MASSQLYDKIVVKGNLINTNQPRTKTYKGFSSNVPTFALYDIALIKQDIINHFHIRQGEMLERPTFGTVIWDILYEPLTEQLKQLIVKNVQDIINFDPRVVARNVTVSSYENGLRIDCELEYLLYNISEKMQLTFDQNNTIM
jgi:phage baseplate assembly protein W